METISRVNMKRKIKPIIEKELLKISNSKKLKNKQTRFKIKSYGNKGFSAELDHFNFGILINAYQNGEVSYRTHQANISEGRIICIEPAEEYNEKDIDDKIKQMFKDIKEELKNSDI